MTSLGSDAIDVIFNVARTCRHFLERPVSEELLRRVYDLAKMGPTTANCCPMRIVFLTTLAAKERLRPALRDSSRDATMAAPVTAIIAYDREFYEHLPRLYPQRDARARYAGKPDLIQTTAFRNSSLQGAYFIIAARAIGLDCGPASGFDNAIVDAAFFPGGKVKSNFLCNLGFGDRSKLHPRYPRLSFEEACSII
jgi:3-hydroxypropanoate dehydrogenase